ncbi:hypothetical protein CAPN006_11980 [Capnocytophaga canimorsus]|uniref:IPExxxVDY family protein n=1 Tax=Capnocytophaga canimorsus TaxID=28188 RepID=UPI001AD0492D|nr:IPExxxVDY family protein [Capnocytophaga canimorsus]GIM56805.1 hypothetical protein CAPN006_11980 [Capnocytophaga canimorsus]
MMVTYRLSEPFFEESFGLIAICAPLEDYRLVYFLNQYLEVSFYKDNSENTEVYQQGFAHYLWRNQDSEIVWRCIANKMVVEIPLKRNSLFKTSAQTLFLMEELKQVDFLLKIESDYCSTTIAELVKRIAAIPLVSAAYEVKTEILKSKYKLIF